MSMEPPQIPRSLAVAIVTLPSLLGAHFGVQIASCHLVQMPGASLIWERESGKGVFQ